LTYVLASGEGVTVRGKPQTNAADQKVEGGIAMTYLTLKLKLK
jgi:hypothetical protein